MNDVTRTYPDIEFFRRETTQTFLMRVLFIWVKLHPDLGYRYCNLTLRYSPNAPYRADTSWLCLGFLSTVLVGRV